MEIFDCHIHCRYAKTDIAALRARMAKAGIAGGVLFSDAPMETLGTPGITDIMRLDEVLELTRGQDGLYPFYFINPIKPSAVEEVDEAAQKGIAGFKIICNSFYPADERAVGVYKRIARTGKPLLFHSGILYDGLNASGNYNRPCNFEVLLSIEGLRFALAHVSWPWTDECIALYGKFNHFLRAIKGKPAAEMFFDLTPGTPRIYRKPMLEHLFGTGYHVEDNILWGVDNITSAYNDTYARDILQYDIACFTQLGLTNAQKEKIFKGNLMRFLG